jgi:hypothetical protein
MSDNADNDNKGDVVKVGHRWKKGVSGNPQGRPKKKLETAYHRCLVSRCNIKEWGLIVDRAVKDAKDGNDRARDWLSRNLLGRDPVPLIQVLMQASPTARVADIQEQLDVIRAMRAELATSQAQPREAEFKLEPETEKGRAMKARVRELMAEEPRDTESDINDIKMISPETRGEPGIPDPRPLPPSAADILSPEDML